MLKQMLFGFSVVAALPFTGFYWCCAAVIGKTSAFQGMSQFLSLVPGISGRYLRKGFYAMALRKMSPDSTISFGTFFSTPDCEIGKYVYIGPRCIIANCSIEDDVMLGSNISILSGKSTHDSSNVEVPMRLQGGSPVAVRIGRDTWIGNGAIVMANIGKKCIIGAGSVVVKDIEDYSVAVGNPARVVKKRI